MKTTAPFLLLTLLAAILVPLPASAFTLLLNASSGKGSAGWGVSELTYDYDASNCPSEAVFTDLIGKAMSLWNHVPTSTITLKLGVPVSVTFAQASNAAHAASNPVIFCSTDLDADIGAGSNNSIAGLAFNTRMDTDNKIYFSALVMNNTAGVANIFNYQSGAAIIAHELGHSLGLGHSPDDTALMYYSIGPVSALQLTQDDIDGISFLYPRQEGLASGLIGCGTLARTDRGSGDGGPPRWLELAALLAFAAGVTGWMRRRAWPPRTACRPATS